MMDRRRTSATSLVYLVLGLLSLSLTCLAEPQKHGSGIPVLDLSQPPFTHNFVPDIFPPPSVTPDPLEYLERRQDDLDEAVYAALFAKELRRLERHENDIFTNFISDGFVNDVIPRQLPKLLIRLSRKDLRTGFFDQTDFGSNFPLLNTRTGRIHDNNFRFPSEPSHTPSFQIPKSLFTY